MKIAKVLIIISVFVMIAAVLTGAIAGFSKGFQNWDIFDFKHSSSASEETEDEALMAVGDVVTKFYFDTTVLPDFTQLTFDENGQCLFFYGDLPGREYDWYCGAVVSDGDYYLCFAESSDLITGEAFYSTENGWFPEMNPCDMTEVGIGYETVTLKFVGENQSVWSNYISKVAFN